MIKINTFGRIHKFEIPTLIKGVNNILKKHDTEALEIKIWCDQLLDQESELSELTEINRTHPAMSELRKHRKDRRNLLTVIKTHATALDKARLNPLMSLREILLPFLEKYVGRINTNNYKKLDEKTSRLISTVEKETALQDALSTVGMKVYFDELKMIQENIELCKMKIVSFKSETPKMRTASIKKSSINALNNLISAIKLAKIKYPEKDYMLLINDLNAFLGDFQVLDKTRRSISKKTAEENKKTVASSTTTTATAI